MTFWANRQISTGLFIPAGGKRIRGHTHQEPTAGRPPRLFMTKLAARVALHWWLEGKWREWSGQDSWTGEWDYGMELKKGTERDPKDFESVEVILT